MDDYGSLFELLNFFALFVYFTLWITSCVRIAFRVRCSGRPDANGCRQTILEDGRDGDHTLVVDKEGECPVGDVGLSTDRIVAECLEDILENIEWDEAEPRFAALRDGHKGVGVVDTGEERPVVDDIDLNLDRTVAECLEDVLGMVERGEAELRFAASRDHLQGPMVDTVDEGCRVPALGLDADPAVAKCLEDIVSAVAAESEAWVAVFPESGVIEAAGDFGKAAGAEARGKDSDLIPGDPNITEGGDEETGSVWSFTPPVLGTARIIRVRHKRLRALGRRIRKLCCFCCCCCAPKQPM